MEKFIMSADTATRYSDFGKGDKVICLLHGYLESIEVWDHFGGILGKHFRVIAIDLPGHGLSDWGSREVITVDYMAQIVAGVLRKIGVAKCCIIGHSMGGYVAAAIAELYPELVESLIFFHSSPTGESPVKAEQRKREIELIAAGKKEMLAGVNPGRGFAPQNTQRYSDAIDELSEQVMMTEDQAIIATLRGLMQRPDRSDVIARLNAPVLFIFGCFDNYIPVEAAEAILTKVPKAQVAWLDNSGHSGFIEQPQESSRIIAHFITGEENVADEESVKQIK